MTSVWIVPELLPTGLTLLAGPVPHLSKLAVEIALGVSQGETVLGRRVWRRNVLYLALDGKNRAGAGIEALPGAWEGAPPVEGLAVPRVRLGVYASWPRLGEGGLELLEQVVATRLYPLIVIDSFGAAMGEEEWGRPGPRARFISALHKLTWREHVSILLVQQTPPPAHLDGGWLRGRLDALMDSVDISDDSVIAYTVDTLLFLYQKPGRRFLTLGALSRHMADMERSMPWDGAGRRRGNGTVPAAGSVPVSHGR